MIGYEMYCICSLVFFSRSFIVRSTKNKTLYQNIQHMGKKLSVRLKIITIHTIEDKDD